MASSYPNKFKKFLVLFLLVSFIGAGCGGSSNKSSVVDSFPKGPITLKVWRPFDEATSYQEIVKAYHNLHKNVTVEYRFIEPENFETELLNALANNNGPDIVSIDHDRMPFFADKLVAMPDKFFGGSDLVTTLTSKYAPAVADDVVIDGKVYGYPFFTDSLALYWNREMALNLSRDYSRNKKVFNKDLLNRAPADWAEVTEIAKLITQKNGNIFDRSAIALGVTNNVPYSADIMAAMMLQRGVEMVSPDKQSASYHLADPNNPSFYPGAAVLDYLKSFSDPNSANYTWNAAMPNAVDAFIDGKLMLMIGDRSIGKYIEQRNPKLKYQVSPLPQQPNAKEIIDYAEYSVEAVTNNSQNPQVAWDFISNATKFSMNMYDSKADRTKPVRQQSTTTTVSDRQGISNNIFERQVSTAQSWYKGMDAGRADTLLNEALDRVISGAQPARESLNQAAASFTEILLGT